MITKPPLWMIVVLVVEAVLAAAFLLLGWSAVAAYGPPASVRVADIFALSVPLIAVGVCGALAAYAWSAGWRVAGVVLALIPLPLAFFLFGMFGII